MQLIKVCDEGPDEFGITCDCSQLDYTTGYGSFTCTSAEGYCIQEYETVCGKGESTIMITNSSYTTVVCFEPDGGVPAESLCYTSSAFVNSTLECELKVNEVMCKSCSVEGYCPVSGNSTQSVGGTFDCTNTDLNAQGNTCEPGLVGSFFGLGIVPSTAPLETPSASPVGTPVPTTSSGSSRTAKVAIVVSVAGAVWLASFGV
jgi:hypothetical protein